MKKVTTITLIILLILTGGILVKRKYYSPSKETRDQKSKDEPFQFENGDIIFQTSTSSQSKAIQLATKSKYSHCGIIFDEGGLYVYEAVQPVKMTPLKEWIARGKGGKYVVKRLKDRKKINAHDGYVKFCEETNKFSGVPYDLEFGWSDDKIYCSELVWKTYKRGLGIGLGTLQKLSDFDLSNAVVKNKLRQRYGNKIPLDEPVISPAAIFESELLETVGAN